MARDDDIRSIIINGVEYAPEGGCYINIDGDEVTFDGRFRPKRKQTGYYCPLCGQHEPGDPWGEHVCMNGDDCVAFVIGKVVE